MNAVFCGIVVSREQKAKSSFEELDLKLPESSRNHSNIRTSSSQQLAIDLTQAMTVLT